MVRVTTVKTEDLEVGMVIVRAGMRLAIVSRPIPDPDEPKKYIKYFTLNTRPIEPSEEDARYTTRSLLGKTEKVVGRIEVKAEEAPTQTITKQVKETEMASSAKVKESKNTKPTARFSGRVRNVVDVAASGVTMEEIKRGRGVSVVVTGNKGQLKTLAKLCRTAFDGRKEAKVEAIGGKKTDAARTAGENAYEDCYQAGEAAKRIEEALNPPPVPAE